MGEDVTTTFSSGSQMLYRALVDGEVRGREKKNKKKVNRELVTLPGEGDAM